MNPAAVRFLLSGYYGFGNLGDEALLEVIVAQLRTRFPGCGIEVLSADPEHTTRVYGVEAAPRMDLRAVAAAIGRADIVLSGGGGLLQNGTSLRSLLYYTGIIRTALQRKKIVVIFAQSIGPLDSLGKRMVTQLCRRVRLATVRDARSHELLTRLLPGVPVEQTADPVFLYEPVAPLDPLPTLGIDESAGPIAFVSIRKSAQTEKTTKLVAQAVDRLAQRWGVQTVFVPLGGAADAEISTTVIRRCRSTPVLLPECDLATVSALIARSSLVIGMRLHALILAAARRVPFLALVYDPKVGALLEDLQYPLAPLWSIDEKNATVDAAALIDTLMERRSEVQAALTERVPRLEAAAARNFRLVEELANGHGKIQDP